MTNENSSAAPIASIAASTTEVPDDILKKIKHAWIAALISAGVTLIITLIVISGTDILGFSGWELFDVALILGLGFGIYKKSRTCAAAYASLFHRFQDPPHRENWRNHRASYAIGIRVLLLSRGFRHFRLSQFQKEAVRTNLGPWLTIHSSRRRFAAQLNSGVRRRIMKTKIPSGSEDKVIAKPAKPGKPVYVFTDSSWLINLEEVSCAKLRGEKGKLQEVDIWFKGQNWPKPALTLKGKDADDLVETLWRRSRVKRSFCEEEIKSDD